MGPMRRVATNSGQKPKLPALMGRNKIPAPTAVPKSEIAHSVLLACFGADSTEADLSAVGFTSLPLTLWRVVTHTP